MPLVKSNPETMSPETCAVLVYGDAAVVAKQAEMIAVRMAAGDPCRDEMKKLESDMAELETSYNRLRRAIRRERKEQK